MLRIVALALTLVAEASAQEHRTIAEGLAGESTPLRLPRLSPSRSYSVIATAEDPGGQLSVSVDLAGRIAASKQLNSGDRDFYTVIRGVAGAGSVVVRGTGQARVRVVELAVAGDTLKTEPNNRWQDANAISLGTTVFASGDETPYIPAGDSRKIVPGGASPEAEDWYRLPFDGQEPKLVYFELDLMERDNIPADVSVYRVVGGKAIPFNDGEDPVTLPHEVQALQGNKFTVRTLKDRGDYYIRVVANHPEYKLRTRVYNAPPYADPRQAVRAAMDFIIAAGDSWHANTPRRGGVFDRVASVHQETSLCVACHATHFPQRAELYAARNGYPVVFRQQLQFLTERFYNNPRPFYGFEEQGAVWARVISAPANVLSRMSFLLGLYETEISGGSRPKYHDDIRQYLKLYYGGRTALPPDETNGNTPLVSAYEVAWYSWEVSKDAAIAKLIEQDAVKNMVDLCYQTLALAAIDSTRHRAKIDANAARILSLQRPDGQWAMPFDPKQPAAEFQTGHALWALQAAGVPKEHPQVARGLSYLLGRQQAFGGWMDPLQSYENFRTPFRETQMAILALSSYYPNGPRAKGWNSRPVERVQSLSDLDEVWDRPSSAVMRQITALASSADALTRQQAVEALGRIGSADSLPLTIAKLGDPSKLVRRTAAWAVRQIYSRHEDIEAGPLVKALDSPDALTRWGATRVFATHFAALARKPELAAALIRRVRNDSDAVVRMQAVKGLWQFWFWTPSQAVKGSIEDAVLAALAEPQHGWVDRNLREAIYNIADENIRYLYNNWIPALASEADRRKAIEGRLAIESRLAAKFADVLERGGPRQVKGLLAGISEFELRRGDVYDLKADLSAPFPPAYNRIGNDVEQIVFFGAANDRFAKALMPHMNSADAEIKRLARLAAILTRDAPFNEVRKIAGQPGEERNVLVAALEAEKPASLPVLRAMGRAPAEQRPGSARGSKAGKGNARPDEAYFRGYVEPILSTRGKDGYACVHCHASHTLFNATLSTVMNVVDLDDPENSLLLRKPISNAESEGTLGSKILSHGGAVRFEKDSPEYNTILNWIRGVKP